MECSLPSISNSIALINFAIPAPDSETLFELGFHAKLTHFLGFFLHLFDVVIMTVLTFFVLRNVIAW